MSKKSILLTLLIGQTFLWTGSAFLSVLYRLYAFYTPTQAVLYTEVLFYVLQAIGIAAFALCLRKKPSICENKLFAPFAVAATATFTAVALLVDNGTVVAVAGSLMNVGIGLLSGIYLTPLASCVPQQDRGKVFGYSYAIGSVGTFLLSLPCDGSFLRTDGALYVFAVLVVLSVVLMRYLGPSTAHEGGEPQISIHIDSKLILLALFVPLVCSAANGMGAYFTVADLSDVLNPAFTRAFYAAGLIAAGYINDRNRRWGAVCCIVALVFPFISITLRGEVDASAILSILSYIFYGFFSVYRVVLFAHIAGKRTSLLPLAVFGLMAGRIGDALGTFGGVHLGEKQIALTCLTAVIFMLGALLFFGLYHKLYMPHLSDKENHETLLSAYEAHYQFTSRQSEIFRLVIKGCSNAEISAELYLAESTVKFHIKNILSKVHCTNRSELIADFKKTRT